MGTIILDCGSGNTCKNDLSEIKKMIDSIVEIDTKKHEIIFKWQLWDKILGNNIKLEWGNFTDAYNYAKSLGYKTTASVFDKESLDFLLLHDIPFVKIACRESLYWLIDEVPRKIPVYVSVLYNQLKYIRNEYGEHNIFYVECVPSYPAKIDEYNGFEYTYVSDHTKDLSLYHKLKPEITEMHYALEGQTGLDVECGICKTPSMLKEIL